MGTTIDSSSEEQVQPAIELNIGISFDEYMAHYAHDFYEWVDGELIKMSPVTEIHDEFSRYLIHLLDTYFDFKPIGVIRQSPFVMKLDPTRSGREPDVQIILNESLAKLTPTATVGPADICIEIVSPESVSRDYVDKFQDYEQGGVKEYWLIDPKRNSALFYRLNDEQAYVTMPLDQEQTYSTPLLPDLMIHVPTLWQDKLPGVRSIVEAVRAMVEKSGTA